jgi:hypothetical protein
VSETYEEQRAEANRRYLELQEAMVRFNKAIVKLELTLAHDFVDADRVPEGGGISPPSPITVFDATSTSEQDGVPARQSDSPEVGSSGECQFPTMHLRWRQKPWMKMDPGAQILQQLWRSVDGKEEWRDVRLVPAA